MSDTVSDEVLLVKMETRRYRQTRTPFLFLTKETTLHPALEAVFEAATRDAYRVVVPAAAHGDFDGARFEPRALPLDGTADAVLTIERGFTLAFLDHELRGAPSRGLHLWLHRPT
jgi:hypothetical protein